MRRSTTHREAQRKDKMPPFIPAIELVMCSRLGVWDGGRETWIAQFVPRLLDQNAERVLIYSIRDKVGPESILFPPFTKIIAVPPGNKRIPRAVSFVLNYRRARKRENCDAPIVVGVGGLVEALAIRISDLFGRSRRKRILWLRTIYLREKSYRFGPLSSAIVKIIEKKVVRWFDIVIANGWDTADYYKRYRNDIHIIPNAVDFEFWRGGERKESRGPLCIAYIGRLSKVKGIYDYVAAAKNFRAKYPEKDINFIAVGPARLEDLQVLQESMCAAGITYLGSVPNKELPHLLQSVDVCVNLTYGNGALSGGGVSNALLEQMAAAKLQIVWDNQVYRQVLDTSMAHFVEEGNVNGLMQAFHDCYEQAYSERNAMGIAGQARAKEFGWSSHIAKFVALASI